MISSYSSLNRITTSLALVLAIYILVSLITLVSDAYQIRLLTSIMNYEYDYSTAISLADINDLWQAIISGIGLAVTISSTIILLYWFYRAYRNLPSLGAKVLKFNPKWVVVYFFIPILALWKPFKALEEIWILSTNTYPASSGKSSVRPINLVDSFYRLKLNGLYVGSKYYECNNPRGNNKLEQPRYNTSNSHNGFKCTIYLHCKGNMWKTRNKKSKRPYCAIINLCNQWDLNLAGMWGQ